MENQLFEKRPITTSHYYLVPSTIYSLAQGVGFFNHQPGSDLRIFSVHLSVLGLCIRTTPLVVGFVNVSCHFGASFGHFKLTAAWTYPVSLISAWKQLSPSIPFNTDDTIKFNPWSARTTLQPVADWKCLHSTFVSQSALELVLFLYSTVSRNDSSDIFLCICS